MKTYLTVWFNSNGFRPSQVAEKLKEIGFEPVSGAYDFVYEWDVKPRVNDVLELGDLVQKSLKSMRVLFKMETI